MAKDEEEKKAEGEQPPPETILETEKQRDPEEATLAEQAIHAYAEEILQTFRESVENALDGFMAWVESNNDGKLFDNAGFNTQIGDVFLQQMLAACGGKDTPIGAAMYEQLASHIDQTARDENETYFFITELSRSARDFTWYLRDNLQGVLSHEWDQLRDLAYEGSRDFIPALHAFGLPAADWSAADMQATMIAIAEKLRDSQPKTQDEAVEKNPKKEEEEQQQLLLEEEENKKAAS
jgi:hypothetical protein